MGSNPTAFFEHNFYIGSYLSGIMYGKHHVKLLSQEVRLTGYTSVCQASSW